MTQPPEKPKPPAAWQGFSKKIGESESRRLAARKDRPRMLWFGLGTFGMVGWSIAVPTLLGIALGYWLDAAWPNGISWKLNLLLLGLAVGCWNAWNWVTTHGPQKK